MVYGITGLLAAGKSYNGMRIMLDKWAAGEPCAHNFDIIEEGITAYLGGDFWKELNYPLKIGELTDDGKPHPDNDPWQWPRGSDRGTIDGTTVNIFVDEAAEWLDAYLPGGKGQVATICSWLRQSSKRGQDVYLIIQDPSMLHVRARKVCHRWLWFTNMAEYRIPKLGWKLFPPLSLHFQMEPLGRNCKTPEGPPVWVPKDSRVYKTYRTQSLFGDSKRNDKQVFARRAIRKTEEVYPLWFGLLALAGSLIAVIGLVLP